jgi:hypothetical protein
MHFILIQVQVRTHGSHGSSNHQSFYGDRFDMVYKFDVLLLLCSVLLTYY